MSIKFSVRNFYPLASVYWAKPIVHTWLARVGSRSGTRAVPATRLCLRFLRTASPSSRYSRYTRLWFTANLLYATAPPAAD